MKKIKIHFFLIPVLLCFLFGFAGPRAATGLENKNLKDAFNVREGRESLLDRVASKIGYTTDRENSEESIYILLGRVVTIVLSSLGAIFLLLMIFGGYFWMMAEGDQQRIDRAKKIISGAIMGLIFILIAYAFAYSVVKTFIGIPGQN